MTLQVADTPELLGWILSFGSGVRVLKPGSLQKAVKDETRRMLGEGEPRELIMHTSTKAVLN